MAYSSRFWDRIADRYARQPVADADAYQKKLEVTRGHLQPDMEMLEFGCGTGSTAIIHAPYVRHVRATDISEKMLAIARAKADAAGIANITFECAGIDDLQAADGSCDVVLGMSILHLLEDRDSTIAKVYRMLRPGGIFVSSTTCLGEKMAFIKYIAPIGKAIGLMPLVKVFNVPDLVASLTNCGFAIDYQWQPGKGKAAFIVAKKSGQPQ
jgi:ubiquinone/menaquinone biosynthesis C-methylase UbiE